MTLFSVAKKKKKVHCACGMCNSLIYSLLLKLN